MTKPIDHQLGFWQLFERLAKLFWVAFAVVFLPWAIKITNQSFDHDKVLAVHTEWIQSHQKMAEAQAVQVQRMDTQLHEWIIRFTLASESTEKALRELSQSIAVVNVTLTKLQEDNRNQGQP